MSQRSARPEPPRDDLARLWRADEAQCLESLIAAACFSAPQRTRVDTLARSLVEGIRRQPAHGVEALMKSLPLNSAGGLALLSLAESLLRIPDRANANRLIRDRLGSTHWSQSGISGGWSALLRIAARLVAGARLPQSGATGMLSACTTPLVRTAMQAALHLLSGQFIFSHDIEAAIRRVRHAGQRPYRHSFDMLGEAALTAVDAERYLYSYERAIHAVGRAYRGRGPIAGGSVSVKLSALHPRYVYSQRGRVMQELLPRLCHLAELAQRYDIALAIDAEESERLELSLDLVTALLQRPQLAGWTGFGIAVQAYQKRAPAVIDYLIGLAAKHRLRFMVRLVKGAYWDSEIKWAQVDGVANYPVYTRKVNTDVAYLACARQALAAPQRLYAQFATHNAHTVAALTELARDSAADAFEFQCLFGMGAGLYRQVLASRALARPVRIYAPVGARATLLAYLMRRLLENGAASSFVHRISSAAPVEVLVADPASQAMAANGAGQARIALPPDLFAPQRRNSAGVDLSDGRQQQRLLQALERSRHSEIAVQPIVANAAPPSSAPWRDIRNPAQREERIGGVRDADEDVIAAAIAAAVWGERDWSRTSSAWRAAALERAAELFEHHLPELVALAVREAGKTLPNGIGEVREAVDALRYYAAQARSELNRLPPSALGVVVCISPWNFPLAIFTGQLAAALAAGNSVLAKPAEQTCAMAALAVRLLLQAGIPANVLQLLPGDGERVGARLVADAAIAGVVFTGSIAAARAIARSLAQRGEVPLIAETGGQNAMIVDSTALPEQVVLDVLRSAFDSAGQRCSALRVLCLQREIAEPILTMLAAAMQQLRVGDPAELATDVGPLIDEDSRNRIEHYLQSTPARVSARSPLSVDCAAGVFVAPTLLEIDSIAQLDGEVFGPVLHVMRFERAQLTALIDDLNATGYALTLGIASRIEGTISHIIERAHAGNIYVNRNIIGAVVGVQPFGGQGLSGTGPKAGGPFYLHRLLRHSPGPPLRLEYGAHVPQGLRELIEWLAQPASTLWSDSTRQVLQLEVDHYADSSWLDARLPLRGCAGETNELRWRARGGVRATARSASALLLQLAAALATGNVLVADDARLTMALQEALPAAARRSLVTVPQAYGAVLVDAAEARLYPDWVRQLCREHAALDGPIIAIVIAAERYALERLLTEQTVTVNTAALGGDASLLALEEV